MKRTSRIPVSPLRKRMDQVVGGMVDELEGLERRTLVEGAREYHSGICIKEREYKEEEDRMRVEKDQLQRQLEARMAAARARGEEVLAKTEAEMEALLAVEKQGVLGLDQEIKTLQEQKGALEKRRKEVAAVVETKVMVLEGELSKELASVRAQMERETQKLEQVVDELQCDVSQLERDGKRAKEDVDAFDCRLQGVEHELAAAEAANDAKRHHLLMLQETQNGLQTDLDNTRAIREGKHADHAHTESALLSVKSRYEAERTKREAIEAQLSLFAQNEHP